MSSKADSLADVRADLPVSTPRTLAAIGRGASGWTYDRVDLPSEDELLVRFASTHSRDWVEIRVVPLGAPGPVFRRLSHCQVRYRGSVVQSGAAGREAIASLVRGTAEAVDQRLSAQPRATIAAALGRQSTAKTIAFSADGVRELLTPWVVEGVPVAGGFVLADVYPGSRTMSVGEHDHAFMLDFVDDKGERVLLCISPHVAHPPGFARSAHLQLDHVTTGRPLTPEVEALRAFVAFAMQLADHPGIALTFSDEAATSTELVQLGAENEVLNLAISSECGQACSFCSVKSTAPAFDGGDDAFAVLATDLASHARRGVRAFRLNGYDPLSYSRILDVARLSTSLGYQHVEIFSPGTRFSDRVFAESLLGALPAEREIYVPLYAASPAVHDALVGRAGAFDDVMKALDVLASIGGAKVALLSVTTRANQHELYALWKLARARGLPLSAHFPYPSTESRADRYFESAPRQSETASAVFAARGADAGERATVRESMTLLEGVAPCVVLRAARAHGIEPREWIPEQDTAAPIPGTEYRDTRYRHRDDDAFSAATVACPHAERCAMHAICPRKMLRAYVELHGGDEFAPVTLRDLLAG